MHVSCLIGCNGDSDVLEMKYKFKVPWQNIAWDTLWLQLFICIPCRWKISLREPCVVAMCVYCVGVAKP